MSSASTDGIFVGKYEYDDFKEQNDQMKKVPQWVTCKARLRTGHIDLDDLKKVLSDLGKWETLMSVVRDLKLAPDREVPEPFRHDSYDITCDNTPIDMAAKITFVGKDSTHDVTKAEIESQVRNLVRWGHLRSVLDSIMEQVKNNK